MLDQAFNEYVSTTEAPLGIRLPPDILEIYPAIKALEQQSGRSCEGGFIYGGAFTSIFKGEPPRDIDMCVHAPELVKFAEKLAKLKQLPAESLSERRDIDETIEHLIAHMFPYNPHLMYDEVSLKPFKNCPIMGPCFHVTVNYDGCERREADILFTGKALYPQELFSSRPDAPIRQVAYDVTTRNFIHHRNFPEDVGNWVFCPTDPHSISAEALEKAREKGMTIIMPEL